MPVGVEPYTRSVSVMDRAHAWILLVCVIVVCFVLLSTPSHGYYVRYFNVTAPSLLKNRRLLRRYAMCFAGDGPCTPQAREIKKLLPELMSSKCSKCDARLRQVFEQCRQLLEHNYSASKLNRTITPKTSSNSL